jgi:hypothetical protein
METQIRIDLALLNARPPLRALADVTLRWADGEVTIRRVAVFEKTNEPPWASLPRLLVERNGKRSYVPLIDLPRELKRRVLDAVLSEYMRRRGTERTE